IPPARRDSGEVLFAVPARLLEAEFELDLGDEQVTLDTPVPDEADEALAEDAARALLARIEEVGDLEDALGRQQKRTREALDELDETRESWDSAIRGQS